MGYYHLDVIPLRSAFNGTVISLHLCWLYHAAFEESNPMLVALGQMHALLQASDAANLSGHFSGCS